MGNQQWSWVQGRQMNGFMSTPGWFLKSTGGRSSCPWTKTSIVTPARRKGPAVFPSATKEVEVRDFEGAFKLDDPVEVILAKHAGHRAVFWAYVFPFILMLLTLVTASLWLPEWAAGLLSLLVLIPYYLIIRGFGGVLQENLRHFHSPHLKNHGRFHPQQRDFTGPSGNRGRPGPLRGLQKISYVYEDPLIDTVEDLLPGANCAGCGSPGCRSFAEKLVGSEDLSDLFCPVGGNEVMQLVSEALGKKVAEKDPTVAVIRCQGSCEVRPKDNRIPGAPFLCDLCP